MDDDEKVSRQVARLIVALLIAGPVDVRRSCTALEAGMSIVTRSTEHPTNSQRYDDWREKEKAREVKRKRLPYPQVEMTREPIKDCPQREQF